MNQLLQRIDVEVRDWQSQEKKTHNRSVRHQTKRLVQTKTAAANSCVGLQSNNTILQYRHSLAHGYGS